MTKRLMVRIAAFSIAAAVISAGTAIIGWQRADAYKRSIENGYQRAFSELVSSMSGIDYALQKSCISTSPSMLVALGSEVFRQSTAAASALSQLPFTDLRLEKTSKFISQVGDWAYSLSKSAADGYKLTSQERDILNRLAGTADALSVDLNNLSVEINEGGLEIGEITKAERNLNEGDDVKNASGVLQNIAYLEQEFPEYPTLVYDGPFSEHIDQEEIAYLKGRGEINEAQAKQVAARFLGMNGNNLKSGGKTSGKIPAYTFYGTRNGGEVSIDVSCQGGIVVEMTDSRTPKEPTLDVQGATQAAKKFLREQGYGEMKESYWTVYSDTVMINFAPVQNGAVLYPDLVKVSVCLDNGEVCNFEARGYIMNHKERKIPEVGISLAKAKERVAEGLKIKGYNLAIIPGAGRGEKFVYEMQCERSDGSHCLVYLDAQTSVEEQIFILLEDDNGILAI